jgi:hypothetical protein
MALGGRLTADNCLWRPCVTQSVIANGEPEQAKALLRILVAELRVKGRHDIQPTYRVLDPS